MTSEQMRLLFAQEFKLEADRLIRVGQLQLAVARTQGFPRASQSS